VISSREREPGHRWGLCSEVQPTTTGPGSAETPAAALGQGSGSSDPRCQVHEGRRSHNGVVCGRYAASREASEIAGWFEAEQLPEVELPPRYNVAPTSESYVVLDDDGSRAVDTARWGLIPSWSKDSSHGSRMINARSETVADKPAFRAAFKRRRCLVPVDGYYEWHTDESGARGRKQPYFIHAVDEHPLALAGLYEDWLGPEGNVRTFSVLTQQPPRWLAQIHDRMPVIVQPDMWSSWLSPATKESQLEPLLANIAPHSALGLEAYPVATVVNRATNEGANLTEAIGPSLRVG
jgi:putative SOS response-associated peptidase YedK